MESNGEHGAIHVTEAVYLQTRERFEFSAREPIDLRGRGRMSTYWLLGPMALVESAGTGAPPAGLVTPPAP